MDGTRRAAPVEDGMSQGIGVERRVPATCNRDASENRPPTLAMSIKCSTVTVKHSLERGGGT
ncbi:hypothetical protein GCM10023178_42440 [Actinomadura luteofluorescens]